MKACACSLDKKTEFGVKHRLILPLGSTGGCRLWLTNGAPSWVVRTIAKLLAAARGLFILTPSAVLHMVEARIDK